MRTILGLILGAAIGAFIGWRGRCTTATCPLTSNPYVGGLYGALLGALFAGVMSGSPRSSAIELAQRSEEKVGSQVAESSIIALSSEEAFETTVLQSPRPVLADFWAPWCGPCRMQGPVLEELAGQLADRARIVKINVDEHEGMARRFDIRGIPTLVVFDRGQEKQRLIGLQSLETLKKALAL